MTLKQEIVNIVKSIMDVPIQDSEIESGTLSQAGLDSLDMIEMWGMIEKQFNVTFDVDTVTRWQTVDDVVKTLLEKGLRDEPKEELRGLPVF